MRFEHEGSGQAVVGVGGAFSRPSVRESPTMSHEGGGFSGTHCFRSRKRKYQWRDGLGVGAGDVDGRRLGSRRCRRR